MPQFKSLWMIALGLCGILAACQGTPSPTPPPVTPSSILPQATHTVMPTFTPLSTPPQLLLHYKPGEQVWISEIYMQNSQSGWAKGRGSDDQSMHVLHTSDGGETWEDITPPEEAPTSVNNFPAEKDLAGYYADINNAWVAYYVHYRVPPSRPVYVWHTSDAGQTWVPSAQIDVGSLGPYYWTLPLSFADNQTGWMLTLRVITSRKNFIALFKTNNGGNSWERIVDTQPDQLSGDCYKNGVFFTDPQQGWVTGRCFSSSGPFFRRSRDGGFTWQKQALPQPSDDPQAFTLPECSASQLKFYSVKTGNMLVGCRRPNDINEKQWLYSTKDGGETWESYPLSNSCNPPVFINVNIGWIVTSNTCSDPATIELKHTIDAGQTWQSLGQLNWVGDLNFINENEGWAVAETGEGPKLLKTIDGGLTWKSLQTIIAQP